MRIETRDLSVRYGSHVALSGAALVAAPGDILGIVGPNGSGKSSLVKAIAGIVPAGGAVLFDGEPSRPRAIGYVPQDIGARAALTVLETVLLGRLGQLGLRVAAADLEAARRVMAEVGITDLAMRDLGALSGGQRQLAFLAQALASEPDVLLLDEPFSALDVRHQLEVADLLLRLRAGKRLTILIVMHDLGMAARLADRLALVHQGRLLLQGSTREVLMRPEIRTAFQVDFDVGTSGLGPPEISRLRLLDRAALHPTLVKAG